MRRGACATSASAVLGIPDDAAVSLATGVELLKLRSGRTVWQMVRVT